MLYLCCTKSKFRNSLLQMGSIKPVLRKKKSKDGKFPIAIRITANRKSSYIYLGQQIELKYWDDLNNRVKKSHPNHKRLNSLLLKKIFESNDKMLELESSEKRVSSKSVKKHIKNEYKSNSFFDLADQYIKNLEESGKHNRVSAEKPRIKHFRSFLGSDIDFRDISELLLKKFQAWLKDTRKISDRTIVNHLIVIRTIFNLAIRENLVEQKYYPFGKGKIILKFPQSVKIGLNKEEVSILERLQIDSHAQRHALNVWLFSFYFAGMRISDTLRLKKGDIQNGRLHYTMGKNKKTGSLKIPDKALRILEQYDDGLENEQTIFPELRDIDLNDDAATQKGINRADGKFNRHLRKIAKVAGINKPLTMHIARHTFGNISGDHVPLQMLQKLYRHTVITTTMGYQGNFIHRDADDALDSIVS